MHKTSRVADYTLTHSRTTCGVCMYGTHECVYPFVCSCVCIIKSDSYYALCVGRVSSVNFCHFRRWNYLACHNFDQFYAINWVNDSLFSRVPSQNVKLYSLCCVVFLDRLCIVYTSAIAAGPQIDDRFILFFLIDFV